MRALLSALLFGCGLVALSASARGGVGLPDTGWFFGPVIDFGKGWYDMRYEQRIIIRIPRQNSVPASVNMGAKKSAPKSVPVKLKEAKIGKCLAMDKLIGSRPGPKESLELITRDGTLIRAYLGDGCLAREFYAGAYMERSKDGKLCVDRDMLHARTGAQCEIDRFRLLTAS